MGIRRVALSARGAGRLLASLALVAGMGVLAAPAPAAQAQAQQDIVQTAQAAGQFNTLARALQAAGLVDTLKGPGPFTVVAPTDAAFNKLPAGTLDNLLQNPDQLRSVLTYHVVPGRVPASEVVNRQTAPTVQGEPIRINVSGSTVRLNSSATVTQPDVMASNGIIHVIDSVLLPPSVATAGSQLPNTGVADTTQWPLLAAGAAALLLLGGLVVRFGASRAR